MANLQFRKPQLTSTDARSSDGNTTNFCKRLELEMNDGSKTMSITEVEDVAAIIDRGHSNVPVERGAIVVPTSAIKASSPRLRPNAFPIDPPTAPFLERIPKGPKATRVPSGPKADRGILMAPTQPKAFRGRNEIANTMSGGRKITMDVLWLIKKTQEELDMDLKRLKKQVRHRKTIDGLIADDGKLDVAKQGSIGIMNTAKVQKGSVYQERSSTIPSHTGVESRGIKREAEELEPGELEESVEWDYYSVEREAMNKARDTHESKRRSPAKELEVVKEKSWIEVAKEMSRRIDD